MNFKKRNLVILILSLVVCSCSSSSTEKKNLKIFFNEFNKANPSGLYMIDSPFQIDYEYGVCKNSLAITNPQNSFLVKQYFKGYIDFKNGNDKGEVGKFEFYNSIQYYQTTHSSYYKSNGEGTYIECVGGGTVYGSDSEVKVYISLENLFNGLTIENYKDNIKSNNDASQYYYFAKLHNSATNILSVHNREITDEYRNESVVIYNFDKDYNIKTINGNVIKKYNNTYESKFYSFTITLIDMEKFDDLYIDTKYDESFNRKPLLLEIGKEFDI